MYSRICGATNYMVKKLDKDRSYFESGAFLNWGQGHNVILADGCSGFL